MPPRKSLTQSVLSFALVDNMEPTKVGSLMKIFNAGGRDVFLYKHLGFRRADDSRANPTFEEQKLETDSCKKWRGGQVGHIYNKVDKSIIFIMRWTLTGGFLKRSMTPWPITPCRTLPRTRTALKEDHGRGGKSKELGDMEL